MSKPGGRSYTRPKLCHPDDYHHDDDVDAVDEDDNDDDGDNDEEDDDDIVKKVINQKWESKVENPPFCSQFRLEFDLKGIYLWKLITWSEKIHLVFKVNQSIGHAHKFSWQQWKSM